MDKENLKKMIRAMDMAAKSLDIKDIMSHAKEVLGVLWMAECNNRFITSIDLIQAHFKTVLSRRENQEEKPSDQEMMMTTALHSSAMAFLDSQSAISQTRVGDGFPPNYKLNITMMGKAVITKFIQQAKENNQFDSEWFTMDEPMDRNKADEILSGKINTNIGLKSPIDTLRDDITKSKAEPESEDIRTAVKDLLEDLKQPNEDDVWSMLKQGQYRIETD